MKTPSPSNILKDLSNDRKLGQINGDVPSWMTTGGYQMFMEKYSENNETPRNRYQTIASVLGTIATELYGEGNWEGRFFDLMWRGILSPSTPVLSNTGANRGLSVSCSGSVTPDSVYGFYSSRLEAAILTQEGFGTSSYFGDIRSRGSNISRGGKALGAVPVIQGYAQDARDVSQGGIRRGSFAAYLPIDHDDFDELADTLFEKPDGMNVGWNISDAFIDKLKSGDKDAVRRWGKVLKIRATTGRGYLYFIDKVNAQRPQMYKDKGYLVRASNLCTEISLPADEEESFTCVLSSLNLKYWDEIESSDAVHVSLVFLDCVAESMIRRARDIKGLEKVVRFTERHRALGLGTLGFHTLLQERNLVWDEFPAHNLNALIFKTIRERADESSAWMAKIAGEPEMCEGYGRRNTVTMAPAPNMSTALIAGGVSQGIEPIVANVFSQNTAAGNVERINPTLLKIMKEREVYNDSVVLDIANTNGSVQHVDWLDDHEKKVFRTAFEIPQDSIIRLASARQRYIDQSQSLNLFFSADETPQEISRIHRLALEDPYIKGLYYMRSQAGVKTVAELGNSDCAACEG